MSRCVWLPRLIVAALLVLSPATRAAAQAEGPQATGCPAMAGLRGSLDSLKALSPAEDAKAAITQGDYRFWAVMGYDVVVPSVPEEQRLKLVPGSYRVFDHTGDGRVVLGCETATGSVVDSTEVRWNQATYAYAAIYNREILRRRR